MIDQDDIDSGKKTDPDDPRRFTIRWEGEDEQHNVTLAEMYEYEGHMDEGVDELRPGEDTNVGGGARPSLYIRRTV